MEENFEKTLVLIKPDGVQRKLIGEIIDRFQNRGLQLVAAKMLLVSRELAETHYKEHKGKSFYNGLVEYITSAPTMAMVWAGEHAIEAVRQTVGKTNPLEAAPGTIRHDYALLTSRNLIHASDSHETAEREIALWFKPEEICEWSDQHHKWIFGKN
ncbi:MAG TPA: nucleoside-diphosphate kinase [Anaerolineaceae bacterium]|nr:nucleoside-diphosphate kinase [Anaerolineaceae bacterium]